MLQCEQIRIVRYKNDVCCKQIACPLLQLI